MVWRSEWQNWGQWRKPKRVGWSAGRAQRRPCTVCESCVAWIYSNRIQSHSLCHCGQPWLPGRQTEAHLSTMQGHGSALSSTHTIVSKECRWKDTVSGLLQEHWEHLPQALRDAIPDFTSPEEEAKKPDTPQEVTAQYKPQSAKLRGTGAEDASLVR